MKNIYSLTCLLFFGGFIHAQQKDSNDLFLGNMSMKQEFTQQVRIKASDLEKLPFANLSEAISSWLYGSFSVKGNIVYMINGRVVTDVNSYSIQEINEIILIQNALANLNGAKNQQQLVVIKLKNEKQASGISVSGKAHLTRSNYNNTGSPVKTSSHKNLFHEYFVSADHTSRSTQYGISAGFLHDVSPTIKTDQTVIRSPNHFDRYHANTYFNLVLGSAHILSMNLNYLHQPSKQETTWDFGTGGRSYYDNYGTDRNFNGGILLQSGSGKKINNRFSASYTGNTVEKNNTQTHSIDPIYSSRSSLNRKSQNFLVQNETRIVSEINGWELSPSLNISYRYMKEKGEDTYWNSSIDMHTAFTLSGGKFLVTPALDINYKNAFHIKAGTVTDLSKDNYQSLFPFVSSTLNVSALFGGSSDKGLTLFGSYAKTGYFFQHAYQVSDLTQVAWWDPPAGYMTGLRVPVAVSDSGTNKIQAGTEWSFIKNRIDISYNFERYAYNDYINVYFFGGNFFELHRIKSNSHRFSLQLKVVDKEKLSLKSQLSINSNRSKIQSLTPGQPYIDYIYGDIDPDDRSWTGGFNNRIRVKKFSAGIDLMYHTGLILYYGSAEQKRDLFSLNYAFLGFTFGPKLNNAEIFISGRNLYLDHDFATTVDMRKYYGLGFKMNL